MPRMPPSSATLLLGAAVGRPSVPSEKAAAAGVAERDESETADDEDADVNSAVCVSRSEAAADARRMPLGASRCRIGGGNALLRDD